MNISALISEMTPIVEKVTVRTRLSWGRCFSDVERVRDVHWKIDVTVPKR
jgi:hypothetical protein